jgi:hypothetical protein
LSGRSPHSKPRSVAFDFELEDETQSRATVSSPQHLFCSFDGTVFWTRTLQVVKDRGGLIR